MEQDPSHIRLEIDTTARSVGPVADQNPSVIKILAENGNK